jgi:DNA-binding response OmpR family regulator
VAFRLARAGYEVMLARDGEEALEAAREHEPALAVLDVMMPKLTGYEVIRAMRADGATLRIPVILLTASVQETDVEKGFEAGADDYIRKPFDPRELRDRVEALIGSR